MNGLEKLVPSLEECEKIPAGNFENVVMVYGYETFADWCDGKDPEILVGCAQDIWKKTYPAPTLEEIAVATPGGVVVNFAEQYVESCKYDNSGESMHEYWNEEEWSESRNPATAALRLWMRIRKAVQSTHEEDRKESAGG